MNSVHSRRLERRLPRQAGDTIVEVIIAVTVVATILAGAFTVTTRSTRAVRDSEEHAEALQYLQGQVELLRVAAAQPNLRVSPYLSTGFCLDATAAIKQSSDAACIAGNIPYYLSIVLGAGGLNSNSTTDFDLTASWSALGGGNDMVSLSYKVVVAS